MSPVLAFVPIVTFLTAAACLYLRYVRLTLRDALVFAAVLAAVWLIIGTEFLSAFHALRPAPALTWWLIPLPALLFFIYLHRRAFRPRWRAFLAGLATLLLPRDCWHRTAAHYALLLFNLALAAAVITLLIFTFLPALLCAPNNFDSLDYHLPRQIMWIQHASVAHYPTPNLRQLAMPPLAEYAGLHLMLLTGDDHFHNFIQWLAYLFAMIAASLIVRRFAANTVPGLSGAAQWLAALGVAAIPIAYLEAANTKNDVVVGFFATALAYLVLQLLPPRQSPNPAETPEAPFLPFWLHVVLLGMALGTLLFAKGTAYIFAAPLVVLAVVLIFWRIVIHEFHANEPTLLGNTLVGFRKSTIALVAVALALIIALLLNAPFYARNKAVFGQYLPDQPAISKDQTMAMEAHTWSAYGSNLLRNIAPNLIIPMEAAQPWNRWISDIVRAYHDNFNLNPADPKMTWLDGRPFSPPAEPAQFVVMNDENRTAAPMQFLMLLLLPIAFLVTWSKLPRGILGALLLIVILDFLIFSCMLKWQVWHQRLVIAPLVLLGCAVAISWTSPRTIFAAPVIAALLLLGIYPALNSDRRPLWPTPDDTTTIFNRSFEESRFRFGDARTIDRLAQLHPQTLGIMSRNTGRDYIVLHAILHGMPDPPKLYYYKPPRPKPIQWQEEPDPDVVLSFNGPVADTHYHRDPESPMLWVKAP